MQGTKQWEDQTLAERSSISDPRAGLRIKSSNLIHTPESMDKGKTCLALRTHLTSRDLRETGACKAPGRDGKASLKAVLGRRLRHLRADLEERPLEHVTPSVELGRTPS